MADPRPFNFKAGTANEARIRQRGLCACCGHSLNDELEYGHHVVPNQCGNSANPSHGWLRTVINCVALCHECHQRVHQDGRTRNGAVAPPTYFRFSHGASKEHKAWVREVERLSQPIWKYLQAKASRAAQR